MTLSIGDLTLAIERLPIAGEFRIARGAKTEAEVLVATITRGGLVGRGESVPYPRYGESIESVMTLARTHEEGLGGIADVDRLRHVLPAGALRSAIDLALHELRGRASGVPSPRAEVVHSALTLSLATPDAMARAAAACPGALLKLKLAGDALDADRLRAVHAARPDASLWLDANEALDVDGYRALLPLLEALPIVLLEQPLPASSDAALRTLARPVPICADESVRDIASLASLVDRYDALNVKLDKTGGLTEARDVVQRARELGLDVVIGCMVSSSLALAPAFVLAADADFVDLDGALFLERDREGGIARQADGSIRAPSRTLWAG